MNTDTLIAHARARFDHETARRVLKEKYHLSGRKIIATFGLLSSGKCIETSIQALQKIVKKQPYNLVHKVYGLLHVH